MFIPEFNCPVCKEDVPRFEVEEHLHKHEEDSGELTISVYRFLVNEESVLADVKRIIDAVCKESTTGTETISIKIQR